MAIDSKRIAKNTIFLYARLIFVMGVSLYTSRVVLDKLGIDDYGLYNVVFSVIGLLSFLNGTLSAGTSRFITFDLGRKDPDRLKNTFSTALYTHVLLACIVMMIGETIGIWYVYDVMVCPPDRFSAAFVVYQISIIATMSSIILVPFTSDIMAHEEMDVYAYIGIYEAIAKLLVVFLLIRSPFDRLIYYAALVATVNISVLIIYIIFSKNRFKEVCFKPHFNKGTFKDLLKFSGWNIIANMSNTLSSQGVIMLFNIFFMPVVVAAQAISNQISNALMQFVNNVRQAVNPQIIKLYADGKFDESKKLTFASAEYVFDLLLLLCVPCIMIMPALLDIWLVDVPEYAIAFAQLIVIQDVLGNFSAAFYTPMLAANKIHKNSLSAAVLCALKFTVLFVLFKYGFGPLWARYITIFTSVLFSFVIKPYILWKDVNYSLKEIYACIWRCIRVMLTVTALCLIIYFTIPQTTFFRSFVVALLSLMVVSLVAVAFMENGIRKKFYIRLKYAIYKKLG